ncbi:hypothetical protein LSCM1_06974 [Leishmania martiniquensis]|uniref:Uncharacterized protein n=1 Tax=Leishmania martiniquensis TaxID=1580590 RepID=A0A836HU35_9TRYP|nr:hypothetical protein LSCM1_06974 [Leishmania martiniquensis]
MVSASSKRRSCGSPPPPPTPSLSGTHGVEALRQAVEVQEAHVRLLRARKEAREALLRHIQRLLATGDSIESHDAVVHRVRQAEAELHKLQHAEKEEDVPALTLGADSTPTSSLSLTPEVAAAAADASADPIARIFHSGVEAQLAAVAEPPHNLCTSVQASCSSKAKRGIRETKLHEAGESHWAGPTSASSLSAGVSLLPRSAAMTALLSLSASRQEAGRTAMLAALSALELSLKGNSGATEEGRDVPNVEPAWLRQEESGNDDNDEAEPDGEPPRGRAESCGDSPSAAYSDDFECGSSGSGCADED